MAVSYDGMSHIAFWIIRLSFIATILATIFPAIYIPYKLITLAIDCCTGKFSYRGQRDIYIVSTNKNQHTMTVHRSGAYGGRVSGRSVVVKEYIANGNHVIVSGGSFNIVNNVSREGKSGSWSTGGVHFQGGLDALDGTNSSDKSISTGDSGKFGGF